MDLYNDIFQFLHFRQVWGSMFELKYNNLKSQSLIIQSYLQKSRTTLYDELLFALHKEERNEYFVQKL